MKKGLRNNILLGFMGIVFFYSVALASEPGALPSAQETSRPTNPISGKNSCGLLESFVGDVQILDATRTKIIDPVVRLPIPCGCWISVNQGWAQLKHQNGPRIHLNSNTFIQLADFRKDSQLEGDHIVLYKGELFASVRDSEEDFRLITAMARARVRKGGKIIFLIDREKDQTQLISIKNSATLENRFETEKKVRVQAGEATQMNLKIKRVIPQFPSAVSVSSLRPKLYELRLSEHDKSEAIQVVMHRQDKKWITQTNTDSQSEDVSEKKVKRTVSSISKPTVHPVGADDESILNTKFIDKLTGGAPGQEKLVDPTKFPDQSQKAHVEVEDPTIQINEKLKKQEDLEKKQLIEALSRIRME